MPIKNYRTEVPVLRTVGEIQEILAEHGAQQVLVQYERREPVSLAFQIRTAYGMRVFSLPARVDRVLRVLETQYGRGEVRARPTREHAARVAWRILKDWLDAQCALIEADLADFEEIMLPFLQLGAGRTAYDALREQRLALPAPER